MTFPSFNAYTVIFEEGRKAQMNHLQEMGGGSVVGTADGWACGHIAVSVVPPATLWKQVPWEVYIHSKVGVASDFRY